MPGESLKKPQIPQPKSAPSPKGDKMKDKILFITGGSTGIGKAVVLLFAQQGADIAFVYLGGLAEALTTKTQVEKEFGRRCLAIEGDITDEEFCKEAIRKTIDKYGRIDVLINNAGTQYMRDNIEDIRTDEMVKTFYTNIIAQIWITRAALPFMKEGSSIINTTSSTAYEGHPSLIDYSATKGAIVAFTRSLALNLKHKNIRVNAVAPGPIFTPMVASGMDPREIEEQDKKAPLQRSGEPNEVSPSYLFLACNADSAYITGQVIHPNGGSIVNG